MYDNEAWVKYPNHHKWFNKLYVAELMGYNCGPAGVPPPKTGWYVIRPIYNLSGMGIFARIEYIYAHTQNIDKIPPGYFWCEAFSGTHCSATYEWQTNKENLRGEWKPISCWIGTRDHQEDRLYKFSEWKRSDYIPELPSQLHGLSGIRRINVEFINDNVIEVHLRESTDPEYDIIIPIWQSDVTDHKWYTDRGFKYIEDYDNADGMLPNPRLGFMVK